MYGMYDMYVCMYEWMDGWMDGWMDACMHECMCIFVNVGSTRKCLYVGFETQTNYGGPAIICIKIIGNRLMSGAKPKLPKLPMNYELMN